jgi:tetratricopeptide (TPR) repeat protein
MLGDDELALRRSVIAEHLGRLPDALEQAQVSAATAPGRLDVLARVQELATRTGDLHVALDAARGVLDLVPLDDDDGQLEMSFRLVDLLRQAGDLNGAAAQLERVIRDQPQHVGALESLADIYIERNDWTTATRYLYQLVPLAPSPAERAERLFRLGEAVLVHLGDVDRADDVFLRASDLDPGHVPTLRRLIDVYWRADDPAALVEVAGELASAGALSAGPAVPHSALAHAMVAAALQGDAKLASTLVSALGDAASAAIAGALHELAERERDGRLTLGSASTAVAELGRKGMVDLVALKAAAEGTEVASALT